MEKIDLLNEVLDEKRCKSLSCFMNRLFKHYAEKGVIPSQTLKSDLIDIEFIDHIKNVPQDISISFGKKLRDLKCSIKDEEGREHEIYLKYKGNRKLTVTDVKLPHSPCHEREYASIDEVATVFRNHIRSLNAYFQELENIDAHCSVVEPIKPTFKDDYRRILLGDKTWLHIEVTPQGLPRNIQYVNRQSEHMNDRLQAGQLSWNYDENIVVNIKKIFDVVNNSENQCLNTLQVYNGTTEVPSCNICLCVNLEGYVGLPQPLCKNPKCDVYYHKSCLYEWLVVAHEGGRPPAFGVAFGSCPTCHQPISCSEL